MEQKEDVKKKRDVEKNKKREKKMYVRKKNEEITYDVVVGV